MPGQGHGLQLDDAVPRRLRSEGQAKDIFALVKLSMSDGELCQPPLLVLPHSLLSDTEAFVNKLSVEGPVQSPSLDECRAAELIELANTMEVDFPHLSRGARYLRALANPDTPRAPCSPLHFVAAGPRALFEAGGVQLGRPAPPPKPYRLQVVFHHRR